MVEAHDDAHVGAPPAVDGLVVIADDAEVAVLGGELDDEAVLREVDVLIFVHEDMAEALLVAREHVGVLLEQPHYAVNEIVEVACAVVAEPALVEGIGASHDLVVGPAAAPVEVVARADQLVLGIAYLPQDARGSELVGVKLEGAQAVLHQGELVRFVEDDEVRGHADALAVLAKDAGADGVEGADPQLPVSAAEEAAQAFFHLVCGLVGEGHGEQVGGRDTAFFDQVCGAVGEHSRLAAAGAREDEQWAVGVEDGLTLTVVETFEDGRIRLLGHVAYLLQCGRISLNDRAIVAQGHRIRHIR